MMCLGWYNRPTCATRPQTQVTDSDVTAQGSMCPDILWFWLGAAAIAVGAVMKKG